MSASPDARAVFSRYTGTLDCVHCGLCIPHCPTHRVTGREADSPRGRIHLLRGWAEGRFDLSDSAREHLDRCIVCRTCESICPSGIRMGEMMEAYRSEASEVVEPSAGRRGPSRATRRRMLNAVMPHRTRIRALSGVLAAYQRIGLRRVVAALLRRTSPRLARAHALQPRIPRARDRHVPTEREQPGGFPATGPRRARVALFLGCVASEWYADVHRATIRVLQANGCDVIVPHDQTCCGALHRHAGFLDDAKPLLARNAAAFRAADVDAVIVNAAGCGASLKEPLEETPRVPYRDVFEFLHELGVTAELRRLRRRVTYDPPCHLLHAQKVDVVESVLSRIPELALLPLRHREHCCGAGGVYNLIHAETADAVLAEKVEAILETGADMVVTGNPGCAMQIAYGLRDTAIEVRHPVQLLDVAMRSRDGNAN
ncbi:(Fe-S)-binding protein [bacterium]|nr:(Fe-S)-binding protein [bacterium]